jgi:type I restriction enzyme S subunit
MKVPKLRFPEFEGEWQLKRISDLLEEVSVAVDVDPDSYYEEIGVRSHGKGIFHKELVSGASLGEKRVFHVVPNTLVFNIVFAWEQAVAIVSERESGFIASHRFPMFAEKNGQSYLPFMKEFFLRPQGKALLEMASPGGAGRNKTLGKTAFLKLEALVPEQTEQVKIADFVSALNKRLDVMRKARDLLICYKKATVGKLQDQILRFKPDNTGSYPDWKEVALNEIMFEHKEKSSGAEEVYSVSVNKGLVNQIEHLGRSYSSVDTSKYKLVKPGDLVYTKSPTGNFPFGIVKQSHATKPVIVSPLYGVFTPENENLGFWLHCYFESVENTTNFLKPVVQKGAKNTINVANSAFLSNKLLVPINREEQQKIADLLRAIVARIELESQRISSLENFRNGILGKLFA